MQAQQEPIGEEHRFQTPCTIKLTGGYLLWDIRLISKALGRGLTAHTAVLHALVSMKGQMVWKHGYD
jgi:hypothetical protein